MASNTFTHFTGKTKRFQTPKRKKKPKAKLIREYNTTDPRYGYNIRDEHIREALFSPTVGFPPKPLDI